MAIDPVPAVKLVAEETERDVEWLENLSGLKDPEAKNLNLKSLKTNNLNRCKSLKSKK